MKRYLLILLMLMLTLFLIAEPLTLFFTNDSHGAYLPNTYKTSEGDIELGGYENLYNLISVQRDSIPNTLWLDAGDQQTGSVFSSLVYKNAIGGAVIEAFNKMDLDAATLGNHEFDQSFKNTRCLFNLAKFPFVSSNLVYKKNGKPITKTPYKIFKRGKLRIGVLGLTLTYLPEKVKIENVKDINVLPYKQAIDEYIDELDGKTDLIILLTHNGFEADSLLANQLDDRIDLIVGGHTHKITEKPVKVNDIYIVQTGAFLIYYGKLNLEVESDRIANNLVDEICLFPVENTPTVVKSNFSNFFDKTVSAIDKSMNKIIGYTETDWIPDKFKETAVSKWQTEALYTEFYEKYQPDMAMINCGGIRKGIPAGEIRMREILEMLPFTNYITFFSCYGRDLPKFIKHNLELMQTKEHDIVQAYNLQWQTDSSNDSLRIIDIRVNNEPMIPDKLYSVVSHDYLSGQADKYLMFSPLDVETINETITDVIIRQVEKQLGKKKL